MNAGVGHAGDFAGDPLLSAGGFLAWLNYAQTSLRALFGAAAGVPAGAQFLFYKDGVIVARNDSSPRDLTVAAGVVPDIAVVAIPALLEDGSYDPLDGADVANITTFATYFTHNIRGYYRAEQPSLARYELYRGVDAEPDLDGSPYETFTSLPHDTPAQAAGHTYYFVLRKRNRFDLISQNVASWSVTLDGDGVASTAPTAPEFSVSQAEGGAARVQAAYSYLADAEAIRADTWAVWITTDGSAPDPGTAATYTEALLKSDGIAKLDYTSSAYGAGVTIRTLVRTRRAGSAGPPIIPDVDSTNTADVSIASDATGPAAPAAHAFIGRSAEQR